MLGLAVVMTGCAQRSLVFTTFTKVGLDVTAIDGNPSSLMFGYKRFEGAIIPVDPMPGQDGAPAMPSVFASVAVTNKWFKGLHVKQRFATGVAAEDIDK